MTNRPAPVYDTRWEFLEHMDLPGEIVLRAKAYLAKVYEEGVRCGGAEACTRITIARRQNTVQHGACIHLWRENPQHDGIITSEIHLWEDTEAAWHNQYGKK